MKSVIARQLMTPVVCLALASGTFAASVDSTRRLAGHAGEPHLIEEHSENMTVMTWEEYQRETIEYRGVEGVPVLSRPLGLPECTVRYGVNIVKPVGPKGIVTNLSWAVVRRGSDVPKLVIDCDANGDLADDELRALASDVRGRFTAHGLCSEAPVDGMMHVEWSKYGDQPRVELVSCFERRGELLAGSRSTAFALRSCDGVFNAPDAQVGVDRDGNGTVDFADGSAEVVDVGTGNLVMQGWHWSVHVNAEGTELTLRRSRPVSPDASSVDVGGRAPITTQLDSPSFRGQTVLLSFWSSECRSAAKNAAELADSVRGVKGLRVLSVTDTRDKEARALANSWEEEWPLVSGKAGQVAFKAWHITTVPTYVVVDSAGVIRDRGHSADLPRILEVASVLLSQPGNASGP